MGGRCSTKFAPSGFTSIRREKMAKSRPTAVTGRAATDEVGDGALAPDEHEGDEIVLRRRGSAGEPSGGVTCESGGRDESVAGRDFGRGGRRKEANSWDDEFEIGFRNFNIRTGNFQKVRFRGENGNFVMGVCE